MKSKVKAPFSEVMAGAGKLACLCILLLINAAKDANAQSPWEKLAKRPSTLGIAEGSIDFKTAVFRLKLVKQSQTLAALNPSANSDFDFTPSDRIELRSKDSLYHLGDLNLRLKTEGETRWTSYSTASKRMPVKPLAAQAGILAAADLSPTLPQNMPLQVLRYWQNVKGDLVLRFELKNTSRKAVEVGSLGIPMIFNNILEGKSLEEAHVKNVFYDPYIGSGAGYLQVCRLDGNGPVLLVIPYGNTPFEAYNPLLDDPTPRGITFEGFHEWMVHSKAHAENEWKGARPWNEASSLILKPGESHSYALQFVLASSVRNIENILVSYGRPVAVGIPGYVISQNTEAKLFINYKSKVRSIVAEPAGALVLRKSEDTGTGWSAYTVKGVTWGRARLTLSYADGLKQTISYKVIKPEEQVVADFGKFLTHQQWFDKPGDPFGRSPSVISYDYELKSQVLEDKRAWIAGLSDEGGAGSWLGAIMKQLVQPDKQEVAKLELFVNKTIWGNLQYSGGEQMYGVKKSLFYYEPDKMPEGTYSKEINYKTWSAWKIKEAMSPGRSYNYPHVAAAYWVLYRLGRNYTNLVTMKNWKWYLEQSFHTAVAMTELAPDYAQFGQMEGSVFLLILSDLKAEGFTDMAAKLEAVMQKRARHWDSLKYPFGSEMPWDSTGQEEVYMWSDYFGFREKADVTLNAILAYMPALPHWGYNGSARRYWDFLYGGKLSRVERQLHHYGSGLNAIPVLAEFRNKPDDLYLLRVGQGGLLGSISNITQDGFGPAAFHSYPSTLEIDGLSGDYGSNFFGYAVNNGTYITRSKELGWLSFGGKLEKQGVWINVQITSGAKSRVFIAPLGLWLVLDAGKFDKVSFNPETGQVRILPDAATGYAPDAFLHADYISAGGPGKTLDLGGRYKMEHGAWKIPLAKVPVWIDLK